MKSAAVQDHHWSYGGGVDVNGRPHGAGELLYIFEDDRQGDIFIGWFLHGLKNGPGEYRFKKNGAVAFTMFVDDKPHGFGITTLPDGTVGRAQYVNGFANGYGEDQFSDKTSRIAQFKEGKLHGKALFAFKNGTRVVHEFLEGASQSITTGMFLVCNHSLLYFDDCVAFICGLFLLQSIV
jgi:hypothetical protein